MATYTTTQDGNDQSDSTWGGGGHPTSNDDIRVIGHKVTYDAGASAVTWGSVTINSGGMFVFPANASSTLSFNATAVLTVNSGGEVRTGTTSAVGEVDAAYTLTIQWAHGSTSRNVFVVAVGGNVDIRGDADYYGATRYAYLDADWTSGSTLYLQGDMTGKWAAGRIFYIFDNADSYATNGYQTQGDTYTISSVGSYDSGNDRTPIVVTAANPTRTCYAVNNSGWRSMLCMISRNVILKDTEQNSYDVSGYNSYTEYIKILIGSPSTKTASFANCLFQGWSTVFNYSAYYETIACSAVNCGSVCTGGSLMVLDIDVISCGSVTDTNSATSGVYTGYCGSLNNVFSLVTGFTSHGYFVGTSVIIGPSYRSVVSGEFVTNNTIVSSGSGVTIKGSIFNNTQVCNATNKCNIIGTLKNNTLIGNKGIGVINGDLSSLTFSSQPNNTYPTHLVLEDCTVSGVDRFPYRMYGNAGDVLPLDSGDSDWQAPDSSNAWILQALPNSYCTYNIPIAQLVYHPLEDLATYAPASSTTLTIKIWPVGWTTSLDQNDIVLEAKYFDTASGITRTTVYNTSQTYANGAWRSCSVTFTPAQAGIVYFNLYFRSYESGAYVLIDPIWSVE